MSLSAVAQARLVEAIKTRCPDQLRIPGLLWTRSAVRDLIERECGVRLDLSTPKADQPSQALTAARRNKSPVMLSTLQSAIIFAFLIVPGFLYFLGYGRRLPPPATCTPLRKRSLPASSG